MVIKRPIINSYLLKYLFHIALLSTLTINAFGQDTLPRMGVKIRSGKVILNWVNPFTNVVLINIQRSPDSVKNFKTILSVTDPAAVTNGFLDARAPDTKQFYRLFVQQEGGKYFFTNATRPVLDTARPKPAAPPPTTPVRSSRETPRTTPAKTEPVKETKPEPVKDPLPTQAQVIRETPPESPDYPDRKNFKPATTSNPKVKFSNTKTVGTDSSKINAGPTQQFKPPPVALYTNSQGQLIIVVPEDKKNIYTLKFFTDAGSPMFTLNRIQESQLTLEKTNFHNSGWFRCELYEHEKLREKYRIFIPKDPL